MTKIRIASPGIDVEIDAEGTAEELSALALKLFNDAGGWPKGGHGPASGFSATERRWSAPAPGSSMRVPVEPVGFSPPVDGTCP